MDQMQPERVRGKAARVDCSASARNSAERRRSAVTIAKLRAGMCTLSGHSQSSHPHGRTCLDELSYASIVTRLQDRRGGQPIKQRLTYD